MFKRAFDAIGNAYEYAKEKVHNVIDNATGKVVAVGTGLAVTTGQAFAAVPADVTTAMTDAKTDSLAVAALALIIVISIAAFKYMKRAT